MQSTAARLQQAVSVRTFGPFYAFHNACCAIPSQGEHEKNLQSPARRVLQVLNYLANPESRLLVIRAWSKNSRSRIVGQGA